MKARTRYVVSGLVLVAAAAGGAWFVTGKPLPAFLRSEQGSTTQSRTGEPDLTVTVAVAETRDVPVAFTYTGTIVSPADAQLQARVTGNVTERPFEPGHHVKKGEVLFRIDPRPFQVALQTAQAQEQQAKSSLEFAQAQVARTDTLASKGFATEQLQQQQQSTETSSAAQVQQAEAAIARQQLNLDYAVVTAPFDGRAGLSDVNVGDLVTENQTDLVTVVETDPIDAQVALSAEDSEAVREALPKGAVHTTLIDAQGKAVRDAEIYKLDNRFDPRTARRLVRARVTNADERFLPGQFVRVRIETGQEKRLLVPTVALTAQLAQQVVYTVDDKNVVQQKQVTTGDTYGDHTAILDGLAAGDRVVIDHIQEMNAGETVKTQRKFDG